jgi:hypothetical protein
MLCFAMADVSGCAVGAPWFLSQWNVRFVKCRPSHTPRWFCKHPILWRWGHLWRTEGNWWPSEVGAYNFGFMVRYQPAHAVEVWDIQAPTLSARTELLAGPCLPAADGSKHHNDSPPTAITALLICFILTAGICLLLYTLPTFTSPFPATLTEIFCAFPQL